MNLRVPRLAATTAVACLTLVLTSCSFGEEPSPPGAVQRVEPRPVVFEAPPNSDSEGQRTFLDPHDHGDNDGASHKSSTEASAEGSPEHGEEPAHEHAGEHSHADGHATDVPQQHEDTDTGDPEQHILNGDADMFPPEKKGDPWIHVDLVDRDDEAVGSVKGKTKAEILTQTGLDQALTPLTSASAPSGAPTAADATSTPTGTSQVPGVTYHVPTDCSGTETGNTGNRVQAIYAYETGRADRYAASVPAIKNVLAEMDDVFAISSRETGGGRRVRWVQDNACSPSILKVALPAGSLGADPYGTFGALGSAGYTAKNRKYLVFADYSTMLYNGGAAGVGQVYLDDRKTGNQNDGAAALIARIDAWTVSVAGHELMHSLGAVQGTAPHATSGQHCTDGTEMMCYSDGSPQTYDSTVCAQTNWADYDCNNDDYFSTSPPAGSYLDTHWNTANSSFLTSAPTLAPAPVVSLSSTKDSANTGETFTLSATSDQQDVTWVWSSSNFNCAATTTDPSQATITVWCNGDQVWTQDVTFYAKALRSDGLYTQVTKTVHVTRIPSHSVSINIPLKFIEVGIPFTMTAEVTGGTGPFTYQWTLSNPNCRYSNGATNAAVTFVCIDDARGQNIKATVAVTQQDGQIKTVSTSNRGIFAPIPQVTVDGPSNVKVGQTVTYTATTDFPETTTIHWSSRYGLVPTGRTGNTLTFTVPAGGYADDVVAAEATNKYGERFDALIEIHVSPSDPTDPDPTENPDPTDDPDPTPDPDPVSTKTTIFASGTYPTAFNGNLKESTGKALARKPITLEAQWYGTTTWVPVATGTTNPSGGIYLTYRLTTRAGTFRFAYAGDATHTASTGTAVFVKVPTRLSATVKKGRPNTFTATLKSASGTPLKSVSLVVQKKAAGSSKWVPAGKATTNTKGVASFKQSPGKKTSYRWVLATTTTMLGATSNTVTVTK